MKVKSCFLVTILMLAFALNAQRAAVLEFKANVGVSQQDVDGISAIFITYFQPAGYTMVERTQIDKVIDEQGFQRSNLSESQMVRIGQILNVSKIVVGDVNVVMGQYNVDVRVINVETGTIAATEGATFTGSSYRTSMQSIAQKLAAKIAISKGSTVSPLQSQQTKPQPSNSVITLYGYLHVFPSDIGTFDSKPTTIIEKINEGEQYGYCTWRIPTKEELSLLQSNNIIPSGVNYISTGGSYSGRVRLVTDDQICSQIKAHMEAEADRLRREADAYERQKAESEKAKREAEQQENQRLIERMNLWNASMGKFSVSNNKKVYFAQGNLQYNAATNTWRFAEHQWDIIGNSNQNISLSYDGWIDLFGWGTGNNPTKISTQARDYYNFRDWGDNKIINSNGKYWKTLTEDEWRYLMYRRNTSSEIRFAKGIVNGINGVILLPDNWMSSIYYLYDVNNWEAHYSSNCISETDWSNKFETNGAVFLPAAGNRFGDKVYIENCSDLKSDYTSSYWAKDPFGDDDAICMFFNNNKGAVGCGSRARGKCVRLVSTAN